MTKTVTLERYVLDATKGDAVTLLEKDSPESLSSEQYWEALQKAVAGVRGPVEALIQQARTIGVYPEYLGNLNLK